MRKPILQVVALALLGSCTPHIGGEVLVDGKALAINGCRSGQASGFPGVDLTAADGRKLRLVYDPSGQSRVFLFEGNAVGTELGLCGPMQVQQQSSRINNIHNIRGSATLKCETNGRRLSGQVSFENCH
jgi:hypothetical protein